MVAEEDVIATTSGVSRTRYGEPFPGPGHASSAERAADHIRRLIFENRVHTGDRLRQDEIAADLRVSRVPVREAIIALGREGWVTVELNRGAFVTGLDESLTRDHYEILGLFYGLNARRAAERGTREQIEELVAAARELWTVPDLDEFLWKNNEFLRLLLHTAESRRLISIARALTTNIVPGNFFAEVPGVLPVHKRGIHSVVSAIRTRDGQRAEAEFATLLRGHGDHVVELLTSRGVIR